MSEVQRNHNFVFAQFIIFNLNELEILLKMIGISDVDHHSQVNLIGNYFKKGYQQQTYKLTTTVWGV